MSGKITEADHTLQQALAIFPGYHYALGNLAKVRIEQKRYEDAVHLLQQRYRAAAHAENLYDIWTITYCRARADRYASPGGYD
jgi:Flp pilus assembly protein TadD